MQKKKKELRSGSILLPLLFFHVTFYIFSLKILLPVNLTRKQKNNVQMPALASARCNSLYGIYSLFNNHSFPRKTGENYHIAQREFS